MSIFLKEEKGLTHFFSVLFLVDLLGSTLVWAMFRTGVPFLNPAWTLGIFWLMAALFIFANTWLHVLPHSLTRILAWWSGLWMGFLYYGFLSLPVFFLALLGGWYAGATYWAENTSRILFGLTIALVLIGLIRAISPQVRKITLQTGKKIAHPYTLAFASDIHFGGLFGKWHARRLVRWLNNQHPDAVLLGGDIVDGDLLFVQQEKTLEVLREIRARDGVYAVYGNHDKRMGTAPLEKYLLEQEGIRFLVDETCQITSEITLTGMDDYLFGERKAEFAPEEGRYNIFMEHEPQRIRQAAEKGYDLYFAGHTHAGQMFPNRIFTKRLFALDYGQKRFGQLTAIVSSGWGLWGVPLRIGPRSEIVVVTLLP